MKANKPKTLTPKDFETQLEYDMYSILKAMRDEMQSAISVDELEGDWMERGERLVNKLERS